MPSKHILYPNEVQNSVFLDFEGEGRKQDNKYPLPHIAGLYSRKPIDKSNRKYKVLIFRDDWVAPKNGYYQIASLVEFKKAFRNLITEVKNRGGKVIYWSDYERRVIGEHIPKLLDDFESVGFNLLPAMRKVKNRRNGELDQDIGKTLNQYLTEFNLPNHVVDEIDPGPAELCRLIDKYSEKNSRWGNWTDNEKEYVHKLLKYNKQDCKAVWRLSKKLANLNMHRKNNIT